MPTASRPDRPRTLTAPDALVTALAVALCGLAFAPHVTQSVDLLHDGMVAKPALDVASGQVLYRDTIAPYGPLTTWLHAALLRAFGETILTLRYASLVGNVLAAGALAATWSCFLPRPLALVAVACWIAVWPFRIVPMVAWPSVYWLLFHALTMLAVVMAVRGPRPARWAAVAGVQAGLAFWARQLPVGVMTIAGAVTGFLLLGWLRLADSRQARRLAAAATAGAATVMVGVFAVLAWQHSIGGWLRYTIGWAAEWQRVRGHGLLGGLLALDRLWRPGLALAVGWIAIAVAASRAQARHPVLCIAVVAAGVVAWTAVLGDAATRALWGVWPIGLAAITAATAATVVRHRSAADEMLAARVAVLPLCLGAWTQLYPLGDPAHAFWGLAPSYGLVVLAAWELLGHRTWLASLALLGVLVPYLAWVEPAAMRTRANTQAEVRRPPLVAGMRTAPGYVVEFDRIADVLDGYSRERPGWPMLLEVDDLPLLLGFAPDRSNPGPVSWALHGIEYDAEARAHFVLDRRPVVVLPLNGRTSDPVHRAMAAVGYRSLLRFRWAELLVPMSSDASDRP